jgi:hypothetical protein
MRRGGFSYEYARPFVKGTYRTYSMLLFFRLHYIQTFCQYRLCKADHAYLTYLMLQRQVSHLNGHKLDHAKFEHLIFSMSGIALSCTANMFILMILYDFWLLPTIIVYIRKVESRVQIAERCAPKFSGGWKAMYKCNVALNENMWKDILTISWDPSHSNIMELHTLRLVLVCRTGADWFIHCVYIVTI